MKYHEIFPISRSELAVLVDSDYETAIIEALSSAACYDPDWQWVQEVCLRFLGHTDLGVCQSMNQGFAPFCNLKARVS